MLGLVVGLILLGFAPLWWVYFGNLWSREAYQFFPLALAGVGLLLFREYEEFPRPLVPGSAWVAGTLLLVSLLLLAFGTYIWSPWVGAVALLPTLAGLVWWLGGWPLFRQLFPAGLLFLTIILPPMKLDEVFTLQLQHLSTIGSSYVLNLLNVTHQMYGNVIEIPGHKLLVEEACSGMKSVLFTAAATIFYMFWRRRSLLVVLISMALVLGVVLLGNVVRITSGAWLEYHYQINILTGARHETAGMILLASYLGFILLLNRIYVKLGVPVIEKKGLPSEVNRIPSRAPLYPFWMKVGVSGFLLLGIAQLGRAWQRQNEDHLYVKTSASVLDKNTVINLPDEISTWYRIQSGGPTLLKVEAFGGISSQVWQYRKGRLVATISLDYPFTGYHDVKICYTGNGWQVADEKLRPYMGNSGEAPYQEVKMNKDNFREATLWFSTIDDKGKWMEKSFTRMNILERFRHELGESTTTYRMQMIVHGTEPLSEVDLQNARSFYEKIREPIVEVLLPKLKLAVR